MGISLAANRRCGYKKEGLAVGTGFKGGYIVPAICLTCCDISTQDFQTYLETKAIPSCS